MRVLGAHMRASTWARSAAPPSSSMIEPITCNFSEPAARSTSVYSPSCGASASLVPEVIRPAPTMPQARSPEASTASVMTAWWAR